MDEDADRGAKCALQITYLLDSGTGGGFRKRLSVTN
jgi:hypothetical protein